MAENVRKAESEGEKLREKKEEKRKDGTVKEKVKDGMVKEMKKKDRTVKEIKKPKEVSVSEKRSQKDKDSSRIIRKSIRSDKSQTMWISTSSFKVGHISPGPEEPQATVSKMCSILGLGLPSTIERRFDRQLYQPQCGQFAGTNQPRCSSVCRSCSSFCYISARDQPTFCPASVSSSNGSSLRPVSIASSNSRHSTSSSVTVLSVKSDEQGLETVHEQQRKERDEHRMSEDSVSSADMAETHLQRKQVLRRQMLHATKLNISGSSTPPNWIRPVE
jgi:hypothetical protein